MSHSCRSPLASTRRLEGIHLAETLEPRWLLADSAALIGRAIPRSLSIDDPPAIVEGNSRAKKLVFTVTLSQASNETVNVHYATVNGTARSPSDFMAQSGTLRFRPGQTVRTVKVVILGDAIVETPPTETFSLKLSNPTNARIAHASGTGTIEDNDLVVGLAIDDPAAISEGNSGTRNLTFTVTLSPANTQTVTVDYTTADGTALAPGDYSSVSGTLTFDPGQTTQTIEVPIVGDTVVETPATETFTVNLSNPTNTTIVDDSGTGTLLDDDQPAVLSINNPAPITEGDGGTKNLTFTVTLSPASPQPVTVDFATLNGSALAPGDYTATSGTLTFNPGQTTQTITVPVVGDAVPEFPTTETFTVNLSNPTDATIIDASGTGTIVDDDPSATGLSIDDPTAITEGNSGTSNLTFTVTLSAASSQTVTVDYATANGTAIAPGDYSASSGTLTFNPGQTTQTINVPVVGDTILETPATETFTVNLSNATNVAILDAAGTGTILDDDQSTGGLSINDPAAITEGNSGTKNLAFTVTLSPASAQTVTVNYATANGTAIAPGDYSTTSGTLTFNPGQTTQTINVPIIGDTIIETPATEIFTVNLSNPTNATIVDASGTGTILDDDQPPGLSINDPPAITESDSGTKNLAFTVTLSAASTQMVNVNYATANGTAVAPGDYTATSGTLTFTPGQTTQTINVPIVGDTLTETPATETFTVNLSNATNATIVDASGAGTITDNDPGTGLSISDPAAITEGDSGTQNLIFTVTLSQASTQTVTVNFATANGTAIAPGDYAATSGTLIFTAGQVSQTINVPIVGDTVMETPATETFTVNLSNPTSATIVDASGTGTIIDNDQEPAIVVDDGDASFATVGGGWQTAAGGFQGDIRIAHNGNGTNQAIWTFNGLTPGPYRVSMTWPPGSDRASNAPLTISGGAAPLIIPTANQKIAPSGFTDFGVVWQDLISGYQVSGSRLVVTLTDGGADGFVVADAIRIQKVAVLPSPAPPSSAMPAFSTTALPVEPGTADAAIATRRDLAGVFLSSPGNGLISDLWSSPSDLLA